MPKGNKNPVPFQAPAKFTSETGRLAALGNRGPTRPNVLTQALISQLNEVNKQTGQEKKHQLVETLIRLALGDEFPVQYLEKDKETGRERLVKTTIRCVPDLQAIIQCWDRLEGKPVHRAEIDGRQITIQISPEDVGL